MKENTNDIVLDENGSAIDKDGNKKEKLLADYMQRADINAMVAEFAQSFADVLPALEKVATGASYSEAEGMVSKLAMIVTGGSHVDFARKNAWITDPAQRNAFLTSGTDQGIADKQYIIDFYKLVAGTADFRAEFVKFLNSCVADYLYTAYAAIRYELQMKEIVTQSDYNSLGGAFAEFHNIYKRLNDASIYDSLPVSKSKYSAEENLEFVLNYIDANICNAKHLCGYLLGAKKASPTAINKLYVYDRETKEFDKFASKESNLEKVIGVCADLDAKLAGAYAMAGDGLFTYLDGYHKVLEKFMTIFQSAIDVIESFKKIKDKAPYAIMHYDLYVREVVAQDSLGSLKDPFTEGSNYRELAQSMVSRFQNLAKTVAKYAPD